MKMNYVSFLFCFFSPIFNEKKMFTRNISSRKVVAIGKVRKVLDEVGAFFLL